MAGRTSTYNPEFHPDKVYDLMSQGFLDCEIFAEFKISKSTFYKWIRDYPEFKEAYEQGLPACERKIMIQPLKKMIEEGHDKGYKALAHLGRNKFGHDQSTDAKTVNNTQININQVAQITSQEDYKKLEADLKAQLTELNIIDVEAIEYKPADE